MKRITLFLVATVAMAFGVLLALGAGAAFAQGPQGTTPYAGQMMGRGQGQMGGQMMGQGQMGGQSLVAVAAGQLGMSQDELLAQVQDGTTTISQVAEQKGVALVTIIDAFVAPKAERLSALVDAGTITQAEADARIATMQADVTVRLSQPFTAYGPGSGPGTGPGNGPSAGQGHGQGRGQGRADCPNQ